MLEAPVRVAIMNDFEVVVAGVHRMLAPYEGRIHVVELVSQLPVQSKVDVLLYDAFSRERVIGPVGSVWNQSLRGALSRRSSPTPMPA